MKLKYHGKNLSNAWILNLVSFLRHIILKHVYKKRFYEKRHEGLI